MIAIKKRHFRSKQDFHLELYPLGNLKSFMSGPPVAKETLVLISKLRLTISTIHRRVAQMELTISTIHRRVALKELICIHTSQSTSDDRKLAKKVNVLILV